MDSGRIRQGRTRNSSARPRLLLVSEYLPLSRKQVVGSYQRMDLFVHAIRQLADLDMLFLTPPRLELSGAEFRSLEERLRNRWGASVEVTLVPRWQDPHARPRPRSWPRKAHCLSVGAVSYLPEEISFQTSGPSQVEALRARLRLRPDAVFAHTLGAMAPLRLAGAPLPPVLFDINDVEYRKLERELELGGGIDLPRRATAMVLRRAVHGAVRLARQTYVCSDEDRALLRNRVPGSQVVTIPNAVDVPDPIPLPSEPRLVFLGTYWYEPNIEAARFMIDEVLPRVRRVIPGTRVEIAGSSPTRIPGLPTARDGLEVTGFVDDLAEFYARARVVCCPIQRGAGTRIKIIEAAAYGRPIVATPFGAAGLELEDGRDLLLREDADSFAEACIQLLQDEALSRELGANAHATAARLYDRRLVIERIRREMLDSLAWHPGPWEATVHA